MVASKNRWHSTECVTLIPPQTVSHETKGSGDNAPLPNKRCSSIIPVSVSPYIEVNLSACSVATAPPFLSKKTLQVHSNFNHGSVMVQVLMKRVFLNDEIARCKRGRRITHKDRRSGGHCSK